MSKYGWIRDIYDHRDIRYHVGAVHPLPLPDYDDLSITKYEPPIYNQLDLGACTGNGVAHVFDFDRAAQDLPFLTPSRMAIYWDERKREHSPADEDTGAQIRTGIKVAAKGVGPESLWPYDTSKFAIKPPPTYYTEARVHKALKYSRIGQADYYIGHCLSIVKRPIVFGMEVFKSIESEEVAKTGILPMPLALESPIGGHCLVIVGRDVPNDRYKLRNSWGKEWGLNGYLWAPRAYILSQLASDFWVITQETN